MTDRMGKTKTSFETSIHNEMMKKMDETSNSNVPSVRDEDDDDDEDDLRSKNYY